MALDRDIDVWRTKDGRAWRIGSHADFAWIEDGTEVGLAITTGIPPQFEVYATLELPGTGGRDATSPSEDQDRHDASVIAVLSQHTAAQPWWLGYLDTGVSDIVFNDVRKAGLPGRHRYVLVEAGPEQAATWRNDSPHWEKGSLPDLMFPADRAWLVSTLWDDDWTCIGGPRELVDAFLNHPDLQHRAREVQSVVEDATPPGHTAI
jgi:hypothetical protein